MTNGTEAGTTEIGGFGNSGVSGVASFGLEPIDMTTFNGEVLFSGVDAAGNRGLWVSNGTAAGTSEITAISGVYSFSLGGGLAPSQMTVVNGEVLFFGKDASSDVGLWVTNGTGTGTTELGGLGNSGVSGAYSGGLYAFSPGSIAALNGEALFDGFDTNRDARLWVSNGTMAGTTEVGGLANSGVSGAYSGGLFNGVNEADLTVFNGEVLFSALDAAGHRNLWASNGTAAGTSEIGGIGSSGISGASSNLFPLYIAAFNGEAAFYGVDASGNNGLWVTNGTAAGTSEVGGLADAGVAGADATGLNPTYTAAYNGEFLFEGQDLSGYYTLWVSNGTAAGTKEIGGFANSGVSGANSGGLFAGGINPDFTIFNGEVLFEGTDASGHFGLWVTDGTPAGTSEIGGFADSGVSGASSSGLNPSNMADVLFVIPPPEDFLGNNRSDVLFSNSSTRDAGYWRINSSGNVGQWVDLGTGGSNYRPVGSGDFLGNGISDVLWSNSVTGDTGFWPISNGTASGWNDLGTGGSGYAVAGVGDFFGSGTSDVLWFDSATRDAGFWAVSNGKVTGWQDLGTAGSGYAVAAVGDLLDTGTADVLWFDSSTRDAGFWVISNGAVTGWQDLGTAGSGYAVAGVGDFYGNGSKDVLWFNSATGDTGYWSLGISGTVTGWHDLGPAGSGYTPIGIGDYLADNTSDVLFQNTTSGDTGYWVINNGAVTGWHDLGTAGSGYSVLSPPGDSMDSPSLPLGTPMLTLGGTPLDGPPTLTLPLGGPPPDPNGAHRL